MAIELLKLLGIVVASSGFWALCQKVFETLWAEKKKSPLIKIDSKVDSLCEEMKSLKVALEYNSEVTMSHARERLNALCERYISLGYIAEEEYVPFKLLGESYVKAGGNHGFDVKFQHIINDYPVLSKSRSDSEKPNN